MRFTVRALLPFIALLSACAASPYVYVPAPRPSPTPMPDPKPPVVVDDSTTSEWPVVLPLLEKIDGELLAGPQTSLIRKDFDVLGKPYQSIDIKVDPKDTITSWHVKKDGAALNLHVHFASAAADARVKSYSVR